MPKVDRSVAKVSKGAGYPQPFAAACAGRERTRLGQAGGLKDFGVNLLRLPPGAWSSQRHWHTEEDELVWVVEGEVVLVEDGGETRLLPGDCAAFPAGVANGHHIVNRSDRDAVVLEVGSRHESSDVCHYPDIDLEARPGGYVHKDGTPYPKG